MKLMICSFAKRCWQAEHCEHGKLHEQTKWCDVPCIFAERGKYRCRRVAVKKKKSKKVVQNGL
jgi:hypothetical protein